MYLSDCSSAIDLYSKVFRNLNRTIFILFLVLITQTSWANALAAREASAHNQASKSIDTAGGAISNYLKHADMIDATVEKRRDIINLQRELSDEIDPAKQATLRAEIVSAQTQLSELQSRAEESLTAARARVQTYANILRSGCGATRNPNLQRICGRLGEQEVRYNEVKQRYDSTRSVISSTLDMVTNRRPAHATPGGVSTGR